MLLKQEDGKVSGIRSVALEEIPEKHELISALADEPVERQTKES